MRLQVCFRTAVLFLVLLTFAVGPVAAKDFIKQSSFGFKVGYRADELNWQTGDPAGTASAGIPNILSELEYTDIKTAQGQIDGSLDVGNANYPSITVHVRGMAGLGMILAGDNQDSDYAGDNRTLEWSRSNNSIEDDFTVDADFAIGPKFSLNDDKLYILPMFGYSYHELNLVATDGNQTVSDQAVYDANLLPVLGPVIVQPLGPFLGLHSSYDATLDGFYGGLEFGLMPSDKLSIILGGKYHAFDYDALADWNLRADLAHPISFHHISEGTGYTATVDVIMGLSDDWTMNFSGLYRDWEADPGTFIWYDSLGNVFRANLIGADWTSYSGMVGLSYHFH